MSCDHKFIDSNVCLKCGVPFATLRAGYDAERRELALAGNERWPREEAKGAASAEDRLAATLEFVAARIEQVRDAPLGVPGFATPTAVVSHEVVRELEQVQAYLVGVAGDLAGGATAALSVLRDKWLGIGGDRAVLHTIDEEGHHVQLEDDGTVAAGDGATYWAALKDALSDLVPSSTIGNTMPRAE